MFHSSQLETLKASLAEFRAKQAELNRVIREAPRGDAGRLEFESALQAVVEAGDRMTATFQKMKH